MGWELTGIDFELGSGLARVFTFEVRIYGPDYPDDLVVNGDGVVLKSGKVRLNREELLAQLASRNGLSADELIDGLKQLALSREFHPEATPA